MLPHPVSRTPISDVVAAIPIKPFGLAKQRLSSLLDDDQRMALGERLARRLVATVSEADIRPLVLSADDGVTDWAKRKGIDVLMDEGSSLDRAASIARDSIRDAGSAWMIVHADLPLLRARDVRTAAALIAAGRPVLAPSTDGGTSMIGWHDHVEFAYGPGSFHRHLRRLATHDPQVIIAPGWSLDLDTPSDVEAVIRYGESAALFD
jgi:2-phospho-L-lactate guanylyltransferase